MKNRWIAVWWLGCLCVAPAIAQSDAIITELNRLHDYLSNPDELVSVRDAKRAAERLRSLELDLDRLALKPRARLLEAFVYAALAQGDAAQALMSLGPLREAFPDAQETHAVAYLVGCAAGHAPIGISAARGLSGMTKRAERKMWTQRRRRLEHAADNAPVATIRTEDVTEYSTTRRGEKVLLIDFWSVLREPDSSHVAALRELYEEYARGEHFEMVGVNADSASRTDKARAYAEQQRMIWQQRYEKQSVKAPITHEKFNAGRPPWAVLIDSYGYVRTIGSADDRGFQLAVRAAVAEARGDFSAVKPVRKDGKDFGAAPPGAKKTDEDEWVDPGTLPNNEAAASLLRQYQLYMKTGKRKDAKKLLKRIIREFAGTRQAHQAQEQLDNFP